MKGLTGRTRVTHGEGACTRFLPAGGRNSGWQEAGSGTRSGQARTEERPWGLTGKMLKAFISTQGLRAGRQSLPCRGAHLVPISSC